MKENWQPKEALMFSKVSNENLKKGTYYY